MSVVTNVLLAVGVDNWSDDRDAPPPGVVDVNEYLQGHYGQVLRSIDEGPGGNEVGGSKGLEIDVWAAAFNHVPVDEIRFAVATARWANCDQVQLLICDQQDDVFSITTATELRAGRVDDALAAQLKLLGQEAEAERRNRGWEG